MISRCTNILSVVAVLVLLACVCPALRAQDPGTEAPPKPAGTAFPPVVDDTSQPSPDVVLPDSRPLTGVQNLTLGRVESPHSYWQPGIQYSNTIQSMLPGSVNTGWTITNYIAANVSLLQSWRSSQLAINYSGGGNFSTDKTIGNGYFQQLGFSQTFTWQRWQLVFLDQLAYLPQSNFGFGSGTGLGLPGGGINTGVPQTGVGSNGQTLFNAVGPRVSNNLTAQAVYQLTPRSSINVSGTYGIQRFVDAGNVDSDNYGASLGYNYQLNKTDTIGVVYRYNRYVYTGEGETIDDNVINLAYGKKITGRLALQLFGGPDITTFNITGTVPGAPVGTVVGSTRSVSGSGGGNLSYGFNRGTLGVNYNHGVNAGSGVFAGSETDQFGGNVSHLLGRAWHAQANIGYARNRAINNAAIVIPGSQNSYNSVYLGLGAGRSFGPNTNFSIAYSANFQTQGVATGCVGSACNGEYTQNQITMNFQWKSRPLVLR